MEIWKQYNSFYEVSNMGQVRSMTRMVRSTHGGEYLKEGRTLKQYDNGNGYMQIQICINGHNKTERVHVLVARTFLENPLNLPKVNHKDTNKLNNKYSNLEWCTQAFNVEHATKAGLMIKEFSLNTKLVEAEVKIIKQMFLDGETNKTIAEKFNVHKGTINCIRTGRNWSQVTI